MKHRASAQLRAFVRSQRGVDWLRRSGLDPRRLWNGRPVWARLTPTVQFALRYHADQLVTRIVRNEGIYEPPITKFLMHSVTPGDAAIDCGANVGYYTLLFAALVGSQGRVGAVEPLFTDQLRANLVLNQRREEQALRVEIHQCALSDGVGEVAMQQPRRGDWAYAALSPWPDGGRAVRVPASTLDTLFARWSRLDWLKLDLEGAEGLAIKGGLELLERTRPHVITEWFAPGLLRYGVDEYRLYDLLTSLGYRMFCSANRMGPLRLPTSTTSAHTVFATARPEDLSRHFEW